MTSTLTQIFPGSLFIFANNAADDQLKKGVSVYYLQLLYVYVAGEG